jgi:hypothetical protein
VVSSTLDERELNNLRGFFFFFFLLFACCFQENFSLTLKSRAGLSKLKILKLDGCESTADGGVFLLPVQITHLDLRWTKITERGLHSLLQRAALKEVDTRWTSVNVSKVSVPSNIQVHLTAKTDVNIILIAFFFSRFIC